MEEEPRRYVMASVKAPQEILKLVERFERNREAYKSGQYNEMQVRDEFINPFFEALGWDVHNKKGYAEAYKDVIHEDAISVGGATKAPDYCFRIGGARKFFLEAKKPSVDLKHDIHPAFQLRRYAWSAKLPLSILTDFEEFAVYDCRIRPVKTDKASTARTLYLTYTDYAQHWDEIASIFSRDAVLKGSFDKYVESTRLKKGTAEVDRAFLKEIESWRDKLARNIALRNPLLTNRELNFSVQRTIDRLIFLRICEDRGIEEYGRLRALLNGVRVYARLCEIFQRADERYNSGLFHFRMEKDRDEPPDDLTLDLTIDDGVLKEIVRSLYYPDSPYEFSVLPANILGQVYEQFLGKVIRLTPAHRAVVEDKPEVKKAGGVYYTPTYIVDYIVKNTVGKLLERKTPMQVEKIKILDPACGSGSFLLGAYQLLLDWHRDWYVADGPEKWATKRVPRLYQAQGGDWRLTTSERKRILLNNIYGVDIDPQAVEVTKLSLLLKVLEGENEQTLSRQLKLLHERALPDLGSNIKCGNSLIGPDFYENQQMSLMDEEERYRINVFDWEAEFSEIMQSGGFDAVIGNPPWGAEFSEIDLSYLRRKNKEIIVRMIDSFMYFVYQGCKKLKVNGRFGMILPDVILYQGDNAKLRKFILNRFKINNILNMGDVFEKVSRPSSILVFANVQQSKNLIKVANFSGTKRAQKAQFILNEFRYSEVLQEKLLKIPGALFVTNDPARYDIWVKINNIPKKLLKEILDKDGIQRGVSPDLKEAFLIDSDTVRHYALEKTKLRRVLTGGKQVKRYFIDYPDLWLIYTKRNDNFKELPNICSFIDQFKQKITCKEVRQRKHPLYSLHRPREENIFLKDRKILGVITADRIITSIDESQTFATDGLYLFGIQKEINEKYLVAILNSRLFVFIYQLLALESGRILAQVKPTILRQLPIRTIDFSDKKDKARHDRMVQLVDRMLSLHKHLGGAKTIHDKIVLQRQIDATDNQIDRLVYELYGLTEEEIKIVEEAAK